MRIAFSMFVRHQGYRQYDVLRNLKCKQNVQFTEKTPQELFDLKKSGFTSLYSR